MSEIEEQDVATEAPAGAPDTGVDQGETAAETEERLYGGKYKTIEDFESGHKETERSFHAAREEAAELQRQLAAYQQDPEEEAEAYNPLGNFAASFDDDDRQQIANSTYTNPQETLEWAMSDDIAKWNPNLKNEVFQLWSTFAPLDAHAYAAKISVTTEREQLDQLRSSWEQEQQSKQAEKNRNSAVEAFKEIAKLPNFEQHRQRVGELFSYANLDDADPRLATPEAMFDYTKTLYARALLEDLERQQAATAAADAEEKPAAGAKARTATRSSASGGSGKNIDPAMQAYLEATAAG